MAKGPPRKDDITDPHEVLLAEVRGAREQLRVLIEKMRAERHDWEIRLQELQRSPRLTTEQRVRLQQRRRPPSE